MVGAYIFHDKSIIPSLEFVTYYTSDFGCIGGFPNMILYACHFYVAHQSWKNFRILSTEKESFKWWHLERAMMKHVTPFISASTEQNPDELTEGEFLRQEIARNDTFEGCTWDSFPKSLKEFNEEWQERNKVARTKSQIARLSKWTNAGNAYFKSSEYDYDSKPFGHQLTGKRRYKVIGNRVAV